MEKLDKLIELLNEYDKINKHINKWFRDEYWHLNREYGWSTVASSCWKVISKSYGFIKRLVDNDKIDIEKLLNIQNEYFRLQVWNDNYNSENYFVDGLLMLLAIQDEPIEFLIDILK